MARNTSAVEQSPRNRLKAGGKDPQDVSPGSKWGMDEDRAQMNRYRFQAQGGEHGGTVKPYEGQHHKIHGASRHGGTGNRAPVGADSRAKTSWPVK